MDLGTQKQRFIVPVFIFIGRLGDLRTFFIRLHEAVKLLDRKMTEG